MTMRLMPFGKHKGQEISKLETEYLTWLLGLDDIRDPLKSVVEAELAKRWNGKEKAQPASGTSLRQVAQAIIEAGAKAVQGHSEGNVKRAAGWLLTIVRGPGQ